VVTPGFLPRGFLAIDIAKALALPLCDPANHRRVFGENAVAARRQRSDRQRCGKPEAIVAPMAAPILSTFQARTDS